MSRTKLVSSYLLLVGLPLAGVVGILWLGHHYLTAPISVSGAWEIDADVHTLRGNRCLAALDGLRQAFFDVSQSGNTVAIRLGDERRTVVHGILQDRTLRIDGFGRNTRDCRYPLSIRLEAAVRGPRDRRTLTGTFAIAGCSTCPLIPFRAVRRRR
jgi:hypothetical protein